MTTRPHPPAAGASKPDANAETGSPPAPDSTSQDDEDAQSQTVADAVSSRAADDFVLGDSDKVSTGDLSDDVPDLVDHMQDMLRSGRIDMDAYRGERNDDDEEGSLGPSAEQE